MRLQCPQFRVLGMNLCHIGLLNLGLQTLNHVVIAVIQVGDFSPGAAFFDFIQTAGLNLFHPGCQELNRLGDLHGEVKRRCQRESRKYSGQGQNCQLDSVGFLRDLRHGDHFDQIPAGSGDTAYQHQRVFTLDYTAGSTGENLLGNFVVVVVGIGNHAGFVYQIQAVAGIICHQCNAPQALQIDVHGDDT